MTHRYAVHLQKEEPEVSGSKDLDFVFESHDDLATILERITAKGLLSGDEAKAFCLGIKLFSGVLLAHRTEEPFAALAPEFGKFMRALKG